MRIKSKLKACALAVTLAVMPMMAQSAGLGRLNVLSGLGQSLRAEIDLVAVQPGETDSLTVTLASPDAFREAQLDYPPSTLGLRFSLEKRPNGQFYVVVNSAGAVNEPFLDFLVELRWSGGRVLREYTALLDPVGYTPGKPAAAPAPKPIPALAKPIESKPVERPADKPLPNDGVVTPKPALVTTEKTDNAKPVPAKPAESKVSAGESAAYRVKAGDTLAGIAKKSLVDGVSLDQMLVAIFRANPDAFDGKNMNRLRSGVDLKLPGKQAANELTPAAAAQEIKVQSDDWRSYREKLADRASQKVVGAGKDAGAGKITAKVEDKGAGTQAAAKDTLKLSKADEAKSLKEKVQALEAEALARQKSLKEANTRVTQLEDNIKKMEALLALKNQQGADLQNKAKDAKPVPPPAEPAKPTPPPVVPPKPAPVEPPKPVEPKQPEPKPQETRPVDPKPVEPKPAEVPPVATPPVADATKAPEIVPVAPTEKPPAPKKPKVVAPPPPPPPEESLLDDPMVVYGGGGLLALLLGGGIYAFLRRRNKSGFEDSIITGSDLKSNTVVGNTAGGVISTGVTENSFLTDFSREGLGTIDTDEVDPIAEAEVYMAYGRDAQAEEILKDALARDSSRQEVRLKLLEIYSARKNAAAFDPLASELYNATQGEGPLWAQAADMGRALDPENPLYAPPAKAGSLSLDKTMIMSAGAAAGMVDTTRLNAPPPPVEDFLGSAPVDAATDLDFQLDSPDQPATPVADSDLDFDLGLGGNDDFAAPAPAPAPEPSPDLAMPDLEAGLDFPMSDFNLETPAAAVAVSEPESSDMLTLDIPLDEPAAAVVPEFSPPPADTFESDMAPVEDDFAMPDLGMPDMGASPPVTDVLDAGADADGLNFDFDLGASPTPIEPEASSDALDDEPSFDLGDMNLDLDAQSDEIVMDGSDLDFGGELDDPVTTKIDLARAYIDMGDKEGAREILQEAINEGNPEQQGTAQGLLAQL